MEKFGRLAQLWLERLLDMQEVTRSSRVSPISLGCVCQQANTPLFFYKIK